MPPVPPVARAPAAPKVSRGTKFGVERYEPPVPLGMGEFRAHFPAFVPKTEEMRVQSVPAVLEELHGLPYEATLKCDGISATFYLDPVDGVFHACGRNYSILAGDSFYWRVARLGNLEGILRRAPSYAVQGGDLRARRPEEPARLKGLGIAGLQRV